MSAKLFLGTTEDDAEYTLKADRLTTHGVVVGMTGSGKTGLSLVVLEELVRSGVPILAIDPKGDLANLALLFPEFSTEDFAPWTGEDDPATKASQWKAGVERSGLSADDVRSLRDKMALRVFTPGSDAATPVDLVGAFAPPPAELDEESRTQLVLAATSGLCGLCGIDGDPVRDREHILLAHIIEAAWEKGEAPRIEDIIMRVVDPPFEKVGVFPTDTFYPQKARMDLAMKLNSVVASSSFEAWQRGAPLDIAAMLAPKAGRTPVNVFSLAHLGEAERNFFLSILLGKVLAHTRQQPGASSLQGLLFFDEVAGYLPPHPHNPPTKRPLLTMMKQARAVGFSVLLSTQNPVDLDYKALSNAGLWCIGRLSTKQDRDRLLKGLGKPELDAVVQGLKKRQFVIADVKADAPAVVSSRHAMCFLKGPMTRVEFGVLAPHLDTFAPDAPPAGAASTDAPPIGDKVERVAPGATATPAQQDAAPVAEGSSTLPATPGETRVLSHDAALAPRHKGFFADEMGGAAPETGAVFAPALYVDVRLRFDEDRAGFVKDEAFTEVFFPADVDTAQRMTFERDDFITAPKGARYLPLSGAVDEEKEQKRREKKVKDDLYRSESRGMFVHKKLKLNAAADETREAFTERVRDAAEVEQEDEAQKIAAKYEKKIDSTRNKLEAAEAKHVELEGVARSKKAEEWVGIGETVLSLFGGRRRSVSAAVKRRGLSSRAEARAEKAESDIAKYTDALNELEVELAEKIEALEFEALKFIDEIEEREVRLEKNDIEVTGRGVMWVPVTPRRFG